MSNGQLIAQCGSSSQDSDADGERRASSIGLSSISVRNSTWWRSYRQDVGAAKAETRVSLLISQS
jgi:hypothetical protein